MKVAQLWSNTLRPHGLYSLWNSPGQNSGVGNLSLLQGIFPSQESNGALVLQVDSSPTELSGKLVYWSIILGLLILILGLLYICICAQRRQWHPTPVFLPWKSHERRSLVGCSPWGCKESDMTERLHFHFSLSCIGEGNGNPLQCSCLENPRGGGAWWAAVYGVAQSRTRLKQLSSSSSSSRHVLSSRWPIATCGYLNVS